MTTDTAQAGLRITITRSDLPKVITKAYELSQPQGMGFLQAIHGPIPDQVLQQILDRVDNAPMPYLKRVGMDYVQGRAIKLCIPFDAEAGTYYLEDTGNGWYDHSPDQWAELLAFARELAAIEPLYASKGGASDGR